MILIPDEEIRNFCYRWKVKELSLFGSALREDFKPDSDVDLLISFTEDAIWCVFDFVEMKEELSNIFGREVDLIEKEALRNPFRRHAILYNREIIYATN
jgi:hypothetical protein